MGNTDDEFVESTLELDDIPQIPLPFRDDISDPFKNIVRALLINQQNIISNCSFLYKQVQDLSNIVQRINKELTELRQHTEDWGDPPADLPSLYSVPEE